MKATKVYERLEEDFIRPGMSDDWAQYMGEINEFLSENFIKRSMGLVCDNTQEINQVYTAVFPSEGVLNYILNQGVENAMLFVHHPSIWDITKAPQVFQQMNQEQLRQFRERRISIYNLHVPLDNQGEYSTSQTLASALGIKQLKPFAPYHGSLCGVFGKTDLRTTTELLKKFEEVLNHKASLYQYGDSDIRGGRVAIIAGGGNDPELIPEIADAGVNTFVTGITALNSHSQKAHDFAKKHRINILGGTHYSTEKFACMAMCDYFRSLGLESKFIEDSPGLEDL